MNNIIKLYKRFTDASVKQRFLPFYLPIQNIIMALVVLIFSNSIISKGNINGELNYSQIKLFYNLVIVLLFVIVSIFSPIVFASSLNNLVKNNTIEYLLSVKVKIRDIIFAVFLRGFFTIIILLVSSFPIACISFYFGGLSIMRISRLFIYLIGYVLIETSMILFISSMISDINISKIVSIFVSLVLCVIHIMIINVLCSAYVYSFLYMFFSIIVALVFLYFCRNGLVFESTYY